jgi:hypothetical protein
MDKRANEDTENDEDAKKTKLTSPLITMFPEVVQILELTTLPESLKITVQEHARHLGIFIKKL